MPEFVLKRIHDIMQENGIKDASRVGLYGLTYKENVDDTRESPTLQLLDQVSVHLGNPLKVYDPMINDDIVAEQYHDFDLFLNDVDIVVIMVAHRQIIENFDKLSGKIVLDTRNVCKLPGVYKL
jgi:UDP-N-acetyl-D-mannosaminuronic acid dehydrogenase